ncbi:hypothetical protein AVEN_116077-1 [Araneus ventricosus]|uniref:Uncharacterized protein n=1 Tax=Araneus ventricosus TaxID=182803 RepID=A0A4Y2B5K5_ARAVE|nr:hypothetical protein AVEN_116077-1 [Araneus ventricosus]
MLWRHRQGADPALAHALASSLRSRSRTSTCFGVIAKEPIPPAHAVASSPRSRSRPAHAVASSPRSRSRASTCCGVIAKEPIPRQHMLWRHRQGADPAPAHAVASSPRSRSRSGAGNATFKYLFSGYVLGIYAGIGVGCRLETSFKCMWFRIYY